MIPGMSGRDGRQRLTNCAVQADNTKNISGTALGAVVEAIGADGLCSSGSEGSGGGTGNEGEDGEAHVDGWKLFGWYRVKSWWK